MLGKGSVITMGGDAHRYQRQLLMPPFHGNRMRIYGQLMSQVTEEVISKWKVGKPIDVRSQMQAITLRVIK